METLNTIKVLDISVTSEPEKDILEFILMRLKKRGVKTKIFTPNPEIATYAMKHPSFKKILNDAEVNLPDGGGLVWAARMTGKTLQGRIAGVDFMQKLCAQCAKDGVSIGLLGGKGGVALKTAECLVRKFQGLEIAYVGEEWSSDGWIGQSTKRETTQNHTRNHAETHDDNLESTASKKDIERSSASLVSHSSAMDSLGILFVAFGFPKQEEWIAENIDKLPVQSMMGVGGAFDFISGKVSRAPKWVQQLGLEWLYRLIRQPWRIKRQLALIEFVWHLFKSKISKS